MREEKFRFGIFLDDNISHFYALQGVAKRLINSGHEVIFFGPGNIESFIIKNGFDYKKLDFLAVRKLKDSFSKIPRKDIKAVLRNEVASISSEIKEVLSLAGLDLLILDPFVLCYWPAFNLSKIPAVAVSTKPLLTHDSLVPPYTSGLIPQNNLFGKINVKLSYLSQLLSHSFYLINCITDQIFKGRSDRSLLNEMVRLNKFAFRSEWTARPVYFDLRFRSVPEVVLHAKEFDFPRKKSLKTNVAFLGPCKDDPEILPFVVLPQGKGPLIYVNLGTVTRQKRELKIKIYKIIIDVINDLEGWTAVISTADPVITENLLSPGKNISDRILIETWVEGSEYLNASDITITHGGSNSVKEAIIAAKPMIVIPHSADQPGIAARVAFHGLGKYLKKVDHVNLKAAMIGLLQDNSVKENINSMRRVFKKYDENDICVQILKSATKSNKLTSHWQDENYFN
jgi:zeaxanthin glucosyltransferase